MVNFLLRTAVLFCGMALLVVSNPVTAAEDASNPCRLVLPSVIPVVVGQEVNIYFDNTVLVPDRRQLLFDVVCDKGMQQDERWTFVPKVSDIGDIPLTLDVCDFSNKLIASAKTTIRIVPADSGAGKDISFLIIGDSLTHASVYPEEILNLCKPSGNPSLKLYGTHHVGGTSPENRHEGYGGWTFERFVTFYSENRSSADLGTRSSPFVYLIDGKPTLDFKRYVQEQCGGKSPEFVSVELGCNDIFGSNEADQQSVIDRTLGFADKLVNAILDAGANTKVGMVMLPPPAASQDAFGNNYGCGQTRWQYRRNQHRFTEQMKTKYGGRENERIYLIPDYVNVDTEHGFPTETVTANSRTAEKITRLANAVHPSEAGYKQMADSIYAWMKDMLSR